MSSPAVRNIKRLQPQDKRSRKIFLSIPNDRIDTRLPLAFETLLREGQPSRLSRAGSPQDKRSRKIFLSIPNDRIDTRLPLAFETLLREGQPSRLSRAGSFRRCATTVCTMWRPDPQRSETNSQPPCRGAGTPLRLV